LAAPADSPRKLSDEEIAALVAVGRQLMLAGNISNARLVLQQAAEAGNATAAFELGATYDPFILQQLKTVPAMTDMAKIETARRWYEVASRLGSTEASVRLDRLRSVPIELWR
jgi:TPR repeat protein